MIFGRFVCHPEGTSCSVGSDQARPCAPGTFNPTERAEVCLNCDTGTFQRGYGRTACLICSAGSYCRAGAAEPVPCPAGYFGRELGLYSAGQCKPVPVGFWAPLGSALPESCPSSGFYCPGALRDGLHGGARPIIMPIGRSTETRHAASVMQELTLDISIDDFAMRREALRVHLAEHYMVHPSLLTLEASAGSVVMMITIAAESSTGATADLNTIERRVAAVDHSVMVRSISLAMNTTVNAITVGPPRRGTVEYEAEISCAAGFWVCIPRDRNSWHVIDSDMPIRIPPDSAPLG
jgi:hypothetical protein